MAKIVVDKNETIAEVIEKMLAVEEPDVVLVIPKNSALKESVSNFNLIRHEAEATKKKVLIESVDEEILAMARTSRLESMHPLLHAHHPESERKAEEKEFIAKERRVHVEVPEEGAYRHHESMTPRRGFSFPAIKINFSVKNGIIAAAIILVLAVGGWAAAAYLPRVSVVLTLTTHNWSYPYQGSQGVFYANESSSLNVASSTVPAQLFTMPKNTTQYFAATGNSYVSQKATGLIKIFNAYSSSPQELVATTRFVTPDGKIYRLNTVTLVPGAQVVNGKITPSSITAPVTADKAGDSYNIGPVSHFSIPGFAGTPKYVGFYGSSDQPMTGGFVGNKQVPTKSDIASAKKSITDQLYSLLDPQLFASQLPAGFKILDGASTTTVDKIVVVPETNDQGQFSVYAQGSFKALGFQENDIKTILSDMWQAQYPSTVARNLDISYGPATADFTKGQLTFQVSATSTLVSDINAGDFINQIMGKSENDLRSLIMGLPGIDKANISFWPFWVHSVPNSISRVKVVIQ
ncbi:MAG: hypothetical protein M1334_03260 [Patescibacteria group bacterium]|nr:hypothetical protein [Patescibacteria group bacterium]